MVDIRRILNSYYVSHGIKKRVDCKQDENDAFQELVKNGRKLPADIEEFIDNDAHTYSFCRIVGQDITTDEMLDYLAFKQLDYIRTIKNCLIFFVVVSCVSVFVYFIAMLMNYRF